MKDETKINDKLLTVDRRVKIGLNYIHIYITS